MSDSKELSKQKHLVQRSQERSKLGAFEEQSLEKANCGEKRW